MAREITIIGGGIIGLCCAYYLSESGYQVRVIDQTAIGDSCALGNAGYISPSHFIPLAAPGMVKKGLKWMLDAESPFYIQPRLDFQLFNWLWQFNRFCTARHVENVKLGLLQLCQKSRELYLDLAKELGDDFQLENNGCYILCESQAGLEHEVEVLQQAQQLGLQAREVSSLELQQNFPDINWQVKGGVFFPEDSHVHPGQLLKSLYRVLIKRQVEIIEQSEVTQIRASNGRIDSITTNSGVFAVEELLITAGSWSPKLAKMIGVQLPVQAGKGYSVTIDKPWDIDVPVILAEAAVAITPFEKQIRFGGTMELTGINLTINSRRVEGILKAVKRTISNFEIDNVDRETAWSGLRPLSPDGLPMIGRMPHYKNLTVACGHAMLGLTLAPVTGYLIEQIYAQKRPEWSDFINPGRF